MESYSLFFFRAGIFLRDDLNLNFGFRDRISLCKPRGPSWSETSYVAQIDLGLTVVFLPQLPECQAPTPGSHVFLRGWRLK